MVPAPLRTPSAQSPQPEEMSANGDGVEASLASLDIKEPLESATPQETPEEPCAGEHKVIAKFLVSNALAGSIIGKAGANISELQSQSGARLQLSRASEFFPGTQERVMLASGSVNQVLTALHLILTKIQGEQVKHQTWASLLSTCPAQRLRFHDMAQPLIRCLLVGGACNHGPQTGTLRS